MFFIHRVTPAGRNRFRAPAYRCRGSRPVSAVVPVERTGAVSLRRGARAEYRRRAGNLAADGARAVGEIRQVRFRQAVHTVGLSFRAECHETVDGSPATMGGDPGSRGLEFAGFECNGSRHGEGRRHLSEQSGDRTQSGRPGAQAL